MKNQIEIKLGNKLIQELKAGCPLIPKEALKGEIPEGALAKIVDQQGRFVAWGYLGKQNKGIGWVLSDQVSTSIDHAFFAKKLQLAFEKRAFFLSDKTTTAFRLFNGEGDGIGGLTIDYYAGHYLFTWYSLGIYAFKSFILDAFKEVIAKNGWPLLSMYQKKRFDQKGMYLQDDDFIEGKAPDFPIIVQENNINYAVYLNDGAMTGIFLDQREVRRCLRDKYAQGKMVLNTFSYTGAFSVAAALGGATKTVSVDLANRSFEKTKEQFEVNHINLQDQKIIVEDVFQYFKFAKKKALLFDIVILDPPSFARSKKHTFSVEKDYVHLLKEAISITAEKGIIVASTNSSVFNFHKFKSFVDSAFKQMQCGYELVESFSLPADFRVSTSFPEGNYLKVLFIKKCC